ncbi:Protein kinase c, mu, partial [Operophtera brumata]
RSPSRAGSVSGAQTALGIPHTFELHTYTRPTVCRHCKKLLRGLFKQGLQCKDCHYNAHRKCLPYDSISTGSEFSDTARLADDESDDGLDNADGAADDNEDAEEPQRDILPERSASRPSSSSSSPSANIPLMRIVQSVKHTKKRDGQWLKEGWLVHFTNKDKTMKRHYWRLDSKSITLFTSEHGSNYYKEIPLNEILAARK